MRKISRTRNEWATRMIAPTLNGFFARTTATESLLRSRSSSARCTLRLCSKGGTLAMVEHRIVRGTSCAKAPAMTVVSTSHLADHVDESVTLQGWLYNKRSSGKL